MEVTGGAIHPDREKDYLGHYLIKVIIDFGKQKRSFSSSGSSRVLRGLAMLSAQPKSSPGSVGFMTEVQVSKDLSPVSSTLTKEERKAW